MGGRHGASRRRPIGADGAASPLRGQRRTEASGRGERQPWRGRRLFIFPRQQIASHMVAARGGGGVRGGGCVGVLAGLRHAGRPSDPRRGANPVCFRCVFFSSLSSVLRPKQPRGAARGAHVLLAADPEELRHRRVDNWEKRIRAFQGSRYRTNGRARLFLGRFEDGSKWNRLF